MQRLTRRGFTLPELLVAILLFGIVGVSIYNVFLSSERLFQQQTQRVDLQQNLRTTTDVLPAELRQLDADEGDIVAMASDSIKIRAMRELTFICAAPTLGGAQPLTGITMTVRGSGPGDSLFFGSRNFSTTTDSLLVYYEGSTSVRTDDTWLPARLTAVAAQNCPDGKAGQRLTFNLPVLGAPQANVNGNIAVGAPVWGFEYNVVYRSYLASDGSWYVGMRTANGIDPLVGPLTGNTGLALSYYDSAGTVTAVPANVAMIKLQVAMQTAQRVTGGPSAYPVDSVTTWVTLRNNLRRTVGN